jgi:hypothetical protein
MNYRYSTNKSDICSFVCDEENGYTWNESSCVLPTATLTYNGNSCGVAP